MIAGWIYEQNFWPFVEMAASFVGVNPDEYDREAIEHGLGDTDAEREQWFAYFFGSGPGISVEFAVDRGTEVLFVRAEAVADVSIKLSVILDVFRSYRVT